MDAVDAAVARFRRRIGPSVAFDCDDARQEAALRVWLAGGEPAAAYRGIVDALRRLLPGWQTRQWVAPSHLGDYEAAHLDTPEEILIAKQCAMSMERIEKQPVDLVRARIQIQARLAAMQYAAAMEA